MKFFVVIGLIVMTFITMSSLSYAEIPMSEGSVIIFASFSMPAASLKGWMREGSKIQAPVIIRGLINNSFKETIKKMAELTQDNKGGVQLDPTLFQRYHITQVPATVVTDGSNFDVIYGNVNLSYALEKIVSQNDIVSLVAKNALEQLRGSHEL